MLNDIKYLEGKRRLYYKRIAELNKYGGLNAKERRELEWRGNVIFQIDRELEKLTQ